MNRIRRHYSRTVVEMLAKFGVASNPDAGPGSTNLARQLTAHLYDVHSSYPAAMLEKKRTRP